MDPKLVKLADYGIEGVSYYWTRRERLGISEEELHNAGVHDEFAYVRPEIVKPLLRADKALRMFGYRMVVKDALRPAAAYQLAQRKLYEKQGKELTDALLNMEKMPHATGLVVDLGLVELTTGKEVWLRKGEDDKDGAWRIGYYLGKDDPESLEYQRLQTILIGTMVSAGFVLGSKGEFWHFEYLLKE
jgi:D-alanyl-D-alanine dipeptidase